MNYAIYCRKSTDTEDKQMLSLESQETELLRLAKAQNLHIVTVLHESKSAKEPGRPVFNELMRMITSGEADAILCWKIDRLTRNPVDGGQIQWLLQTGKIKCITTYERNYLPEDNVLLMSLEQAMATQYIRELSTNVKRGNRTKIERGDWPNKAPFGYKNDPATKTVLINRKTAPYITRIFELYRSGKSYQDISNILFTEGLRSASGNKVFKAKIQTIINNPFYTGLMRYEGKLYKGNHKAIISKAIYDECQQLSEKRNRPKSQKLFFPLRGFLVCENCGCSLTASLKKGHQYYYCTNGKGICNEHKSYMREEYLYQQVAKALEQLHFTERKIELMYQAAKELSRNTEHYVSATLKNLEAQLTNIEAKESRLLDTYTEGTIEKELYTRKTIALHNERTAIIHRLQEQKRNRPFDTLEPIKSIFMQASKAQKEFLIASEEKKHKIVSELLWNFSVKDKKVLSINYKPAFAAIVKAPKDGTISELLPDLESHVATAP